MITDSLKKIAETQGISITREGFFRRFHLDSRTVQPGDVYCALEGAKVDGHQFVEEAFAKGAAAAIVNKKYSKKHSEVVIPVDDVTEVLQIAAKEMFEEKRPGLVIGVTGR